MAESTGAEFLVRARAVLEAERDGLSLAANTLGSPFVRAVETLLAVRGRVIFSGVGKSGLVARSLAATFTSTGMPAVFLHPVDALHGDIGVIGGGDVAVALSTSGETDELLRVVPFFRERDVPTILLTGAPESRLAKTADIVVDVGAATEASAVRALPTTSITVATAVGHALAVVVMEERGFREENFAVLHPGGAIGRKFGRRVADVMHTGADVPVVSVAGSFKDALVEIIRGRLGVTGVVDESGALVGVLTDGDLKRILLDRKRVLDAPVTAVMTRGPKTIAADATVMAALERMERNPRGAITSLFVVDEKGRPTGLLHIHDCLRP